MRKTPLVAVIDQGLEIGKGGSQRGAIPAVVHFDWRKADGIFRVGLYSDDRGRAC